MPKAVGSAEEQLEHFLAKFTPEICALAKRVLVKMRKRLPGAVELVYDNTYALVIGFAPSEKASDAIFSVALYPRWINLFFLDGAVLPDPGGLLLGTGKRVRHIKVPDEKLLDEPAVRELMDDAVELAGAEFVSGRPRKMMIRMVAEKQRPRRPAK
jgi:hypothetical protein